MRRARRRQRSDLLQLRPPQSRAVGLRPGAAQPRQRPRLRATSSPAARSSCTSCRSSCRGKACRSTRASDPALNILGASGAVPVFGRGWWWTVLTAGWLHGGPPAHLLQRAVDPPARAGDRQSLWRRTDDHHLYARRRRRVRAQQRAGVSCRSSRSSARRSPSALLRRSSACSARWCTTGGARGSSHIGQAGLQYACSWASWDSSFRGVDNAAHLGGFVGGYLASMILDPLKPERIDHMAVAVGCLVVTLAAII